MRYYSYVSLAAGLLCCLAASPALAEPSGSEAGGSDAASPLAALQAVTDLTDAAATVAGTTSLASQTKSSGPSSAPATSKGVDSSNGAVPTAVLVAASSGMAVTGGAALSALRGESAPAAPPAVAGDGGHYVAAQAPPGTDLSSLSDTGSNPLVNPNPSAASVNIVNTPTPIPPTVLLLGGGLIGLLPLRRFVRPSLEV